MTVAADAQRAARADLGERRVDLLEQVRRGALVAIAQVRRDPVACEQLVDRLAAQLLPRQRLSMAKAAHGADRVQPAEEAAHPNPIVGGAELRPPPAAARI